MSEQACTSIFSLEDIVCDLVQWYPSFFTAFEIYFDDRFSRFIVEGAKVTEKCYRFWQLDPEIFH